MRKLQETQTSRGFEGLPEALEKPSPDPGAGLPLPSSGTLLRSLLLVFGAISVSLLFSARSLEAWIGALTEAASVAVPATLAWLLLVGAARPWLARLGPVMQLALTTLAGACLALVAWWPLAWLGRAGGNPSFWLAPSLAGAGLAAALHQAERWRARARFPAAAAAQLADLQTRIRPHFLFNTLNTAIALVQVDPRRAEEVLEDLSALFRAALAAPDQPTTLEDELELGRRYLDIEQLRFGARLRVNWRLDPLAASARVPPLVLQPLIENAVRHGVEPNDLVGLIEIRTRRRRDRVLVSVTNPVPLGPTRAGHGIGLASVGERLRLMHDLEADFRSGLIEDGRWRASFSVPC